ncbi:helix-turn-helix domain-containing protein [Streptomyces violaceusniger]|uniref:helix-turn-helix domain-containing protein n=1 Tax=Streptomyces violaceusniger TaxID=68280 RepID=UPI0012370867
MYDADHGTDVTGSLETFLKRRRSWQRTAAVLNVHKQTVMYRRPARTPDRSVHRHQATGAG